ARVRERVPGGAAVDHHAHDAAVGLAEGGCDEALAEGVARHRGVKVAGARAWGRTAAAAKRAEGVRCPCAQCAVSSPVGTMGSRPSIGRVERARRSRAPGGSVVRDRWRTLLVMERVPVESKALASIGYDAEARVLEL